MRLFFYGTLIDPEILQAVLRRRVDRSCRCRAVLAGYRRVFRRGAVYPVLVPADGARVEGVLVHRLSARDVARLSAYEGKDYRLAPISVNLGAGRSVSAQAFLPVEGCEPTSIEWRPAYWRRRYRRQYVLRVIRRRQPAAAALHRVRSPGISAGHAEQGREHPR
ncbi:MAG: gamma-glutamylcyclotransferase [Rhodospirillales bacterium]|nr:gamma-glutamylcyclotransferase [Rhodospirillales bacterium]